MRANSSVEENMTHNPGEQVYVSVEKEIE